MNLYQAIFGIIMVMSIAGIINNFMKFKTTSRVSIDGMDERIKKLEDLEERIKILETIITDQNYDLDQKIKSL